MSLRKTRGWEQRIDLGAAGGEEPGGYPRHPARKDLGRESGQRAASSRAGLSFPTGASAKNPPANAGDPRDALSIPGSGRAPGVGTG